MDESKKLFVVGNVAEYPDWEFVGVFDAIDLAVSACRDEKYFVAPVTLNVIAPEKCVEWPDCFFPIAARS